MKVFQFLRPCMVKNVYSRDYTSFMETAIVHAVLRFVNEPGAAMDFNKQS